MLLCSVGYFSFLVKSLALFLDNSSNPAVIQGSLFMYLFFNLTLRRGKARSNATLYKSINLS